MRKYLKIQILLQYPTQREFALATRKPEDWLSKIIHGKKIPSEKDKKLIMDCLGLKNADYIFMDWEDAKVEK